MKMISIDSLLFEIKTMISDEDQRSFKDLDLFIRTTLDVNIGKILKNDKYTEYFLKVIPVTNFMADMPLYRKIVQISGSSNSNYVNKSRVIKERIVAHMEKRGECVYTIYKNCSKCDKDDCDHEIMLNANKYANDLGVGGKYHLTKKDYDYFHNDYQEDEHGCKRSIIDRDFYLLHPTESNIFGIKEMYIDECLNYGVVPNHFMNDSWDYKIVYNNSTKRNAIKTNFKEGLLLVSYYARLRDHNNFLMFPEEDNLIIALKNCAWSNIFRKLWFDHKTRDYLDLYRDSENQFKISFRDAENELANKPFNEFVMAFARAKFNSKQEKTFEAFTQPDKPDAFMDTYNKSFEY